MTTRATSTGRRRWNAEGLREEEIKVEEHDWDEDGTHLGSFIHWEWHLIEPSVKRKKRNRC